MPLSQLPHVVFVDLRPDANFVEERNRCVGPKIGELPAAHVGSIHRQPVVFAGVDESLGSETVHLHGPTEDPKLLGMQANR